MIRKVTSHLQRLQRHWRQRGALATATFVLSRIFRHQVTLVYEALLEKGRCRTVRWEADEQLLQIGPENLDANMTPRLKAFLGGESAYENLQGVREGDRLFVVASGEE